MEILTGVAHKMSKAHDNSLTDALGLEPGVVSSALADVTQLSSDEISGFSDDDDYADVPGLSEKLASLPKASTGIKIDGDEEGSMVMSSNEDEEDFGLEGDLNLAKFKGKDAMGDDLSGFDDESMDGFSDEDLVAFGLGKEVELEGDGRPDNLDELSESDKEEEGGLDGLENVSLNLIHKFDDARDNIDDLSGDFERWDDEGGIKSPGGLARPPQPKGTPVGAALHYANRSRLLGVDPSTSPIGFQQSMYSSPNIHRNPEIRRKLVARKETYDGADEAERAGNQWQQRYGHMDSAVAMKMRLFQEQIRLVDMKIAAMREECGNLKQLHQMKWEAVAKGSHASNWALYVLLGLLSMLMFVIVFDIVLSS